VARALANPHADVPPPANLFYALIAFDVREAPIPADSGRAMVARYVQARRDPAAARYDWNSDPAYPRAPFVGDRLGLCSPDAARAACLERAVARPDVLTALIEANRWLLERYERLQPYRRLEYPLAAAFDAPLPAWQDFMTGKHLLLSQIALQVVHGQTDVATRRLRDEALFTRRLLAESDITLIDKMVLAVAFRQDLLLAGEILRAEPRSRASAQAIAELAAPLTDAERSLAGPFGREFEIVVSVLKPMADPGRAKKFVSLDGDRDRWAGLAGRATHYFYQPNATLNLAWRQTLAMQAAAGRPCRQQVPRQSSADPVRSDTILEAYNPVGRILLAQSTFAYEAYAHRLCELSKLQRLVALHAQIRAAGIPDDRVTAFVAAGGAAYDDPFTGQPFRFDAARRAFDVRFEDKGFAGIGPWGL